METKKQLRCVIPKYKIQIGTSYSTSLTFMRTIKYICRNSDDEYKLIRRDFLTGTTITFKEL